MYRSVLRERLGSCFFYLRKEGKIKTLVGEARVSIESLYYKEKKERKLLEICCFDFHDCILAIPRGNLMRLPWFSIKNKREK